MSSFGKRNRHPGPGSRPAGEASRAAAVEIETFVLPEFGPDADDDWSKRMCGLLTLLSVLGLVWAAGFALYVFVEVSPDACKQYIKYVSLPAAALIFIIVSNLLIKRETLNQILIQLCVVTAYCVANAAMANWLLDDGEPRLVEMNIAAKGHCDSDAAAFCAYGLAPDTVTLPAFTGNNICKISKQAYDRIAVAQSRMIVRIRPGRFNWEWQESGCELQF